MASPGLGLLAPTERHAAVAADVIKESPPIAGNLWHDAMTAILMREYGIGTIYTRDADFRRFPFLQVVDPLEFQGGLGQLKAHAWRAGRNQAEV